MKLFTTLSLLAAIPTASLGSSLDFTGFEGLNDSPLSVPGALITHEVGDQILVGNSCASQADGFCFLNPVTFGAEAGGTLAFSSAVTNLTFDIDGADGSEDSVTISAFDGITELTSATFTTNGVVDFSSLARVTSLVFVDNESDSFGVGYSTFQFDLVDTAPIPLPAGGVLLVTALGALAVRKYQAA